MQTNLQWVDEAITKIHEKMAWVSDKNKDKIPYTTDASGSYVDQTDQTINWEFTGGLDWWTNGFWGGLMWLLYQGTGDEKYAQYARNSQAKLEQVIADFYGIHHDVGFMFHLTAGINYRLTGDQKSRRTNLHAANLLAGRFNPAGGFIRAWNSQQQDEQNDFKGQNDVRGWAIIDCLMNLSLLYWASKETKDARFENVAICHANTAIKHFLRQDGSVKHIVEFNHQTGEFVTNYGGQGYDKDSSWTRGQAWGLYGFVISYLHTNKSTYLEAAQKIAQHCLANLSDDGIVPIDFKQPATPEWEDSCGACIMASGFLELARQTTGACSQTYHEAAVKLLKTIYETRCDFSQASDALVSNCSAAYHDATGRHIKMVYADYFFVEAIYKLKGLASFNW